MTRAREKKQQPCIVSDVCHVEIHSTSTLSHSFDMKSEKVLATSIDDRFVLCIPLIWKKDISPSSGNISWWKMLIEMEWCLFDFLGFFFYTVFRCSWTNFIDVVKKKKKRKRKVCSLAHFFFCFYQQNWQVGVSVTGSNHQHVSLGMFQLWFCKLNLILFSRTMINLSLLRLICVNFVEHDIVANVFEEIFMDWWKKLITVENVIKWEMN